MIHETYRELRAVLAIALAESDETRGIGAPLQTPNTWQYRARALLVEETQAVEFAPEGENFGRCSHLNRRSNQCAHTALHRIGGHVYCKRHAQERAIP